MISSPTISRNAIFSGIFAPLLWLLFIVSLLSAHQAVAQTMARRGWTGAGATAEPWWHRAVFYRIDPARFQASGVASTGDLAGLARRLDYLQSLGVDALVLEASSPSDKPSANPFDPDALEGLIREASRHNLRILPTLSPALEHGDRTLLLQTVHEWLAEGAAGIAIPESFGDGSHEADADPSLLTMLDGLLHATPGDRVLLTGSTGLPVTRPGSFRNRSGRLTLAAILPAYPSTAADLRPALATPDASPGNRPLYPWLRLRTSPPLTASAPNRSSRDLATGNAVPAAAVLLASGMATLFDFGAEIGLNTARAANDPIPTLMQWTPANVQQAPLERRDTASAPPAPGQPTPFGAYKPFVHPPPRSLTGNLPAGPTVEVNRDLPPPPADPNTLPGFTAGSLFSPPIDGAILNVATQDRDPHSILNAFRALIALHAGNPALHVGQQVLLHPVPAGGRGAGTAQALGATQVPRAEDAIVFLRRPPPGVRTAGAVVVAVNLGDTPLLLSLDAELATLRLRPGSLRSLFSYGPQSLTGESTGSLQLPPHAVFLGELHPR